jgi:tellurite resistance protein TerC
LQYGLAIILTFIGVKMVINPLFHIESWISLAIVGGVLVGSILLSLAFPDKEDESEGAEGEA